MKMDNISSDRSPAISESNSGSWSRYWDNERCSDLGLNLGQKEVDTLAEDKEIAARAVAFVVSSTRKGVVPLCADVANLMREKKRLEKKVFFLQHENQALRLSAGFHSNITSNSTSPVPSFDKSYQSEQGGQIKSRPCSRCSQHSGCTDAIPKCLQQSLVQQRQNSNSLSSDTSNSFTAVAIIHCPPGGNFEESVQSNDLERNNSLPEIICQPDNDVPKVSPACIKLESSISRSPGKALEQQLQDSIQLNLKLAQDLGAAKKEIEILRARLREFELRNTTQQLIEASFDLISSKTMQNHVIENNLTENVNRHSSSITMLPNSLPGCKCIECCNSSHNTNGKSIKTDKKSTIRPLLQLGDHVVVKGDRTGYIRYIGHLEESLQPSLVFVGLELEASVGCHDGCFNDKRYFTCPRNHGIFLPISDVMCLLSKKSNRKLADSSKSTSEFEPGTSSVESSVEMVSLDQDVQTPKNGEVINTML